MPRRESPTVIRHYAEDGAGTIQAFYTFRKSYAGSGIKDLTSSLKALPGFLRHAFYL